MCVAARGSGAIEIVNEFAALRLELDLAANGPRLLVTDLVTGHRRHLDPLEINGLLWLSDAELALLADPSRTGWRDAAR